MSDLLIQSATTWNQPESRATFSAQAAAAEQSDLPAQILSSLDGIVVPDVEPPTGYRMAIGALAAALVLVLTIFAAMLVFLVWLLAWHVEQIAQTTQEGPYFIFHLPMALISAVLLVFCLKPLVRRGKSRANAQIVLSREKEPNLFAFVEKLCEAMDAPKPARIVVDCRINAAARRMGMFATRNGLELQIGLPLAAALPANEFAGVLAHELGHFKQRGGMLSSDFVFRLTYLLSVIVFHRDKLDQRLALMRRSRKAGKRLLFMMLYPPVEAGRGVLWLMMMICQVLCCGTSRRMEYLADESNASICGADGFERTSRSLFLLGIANSRATHDLQQAWNERRLADDWIALMIAHAAQLAQYREEFHKLQDNEKPHWYDTHPTFQQRLAHLRELDVTALMHCDLPTKHLFSDFDASCRSASAAAYRSYLGNSFDEAKLIPAKSLESEGIEHRASGKALHRFLRGSVIRLRPVIPTNGCATAPENVESTIEQLRQARDQMLTAAETTSQLGERLWSTEAKVATAKSRAYLYDLLSTHFNYRRAAKQWKTQLNELENQQRSLIQTAELFEAPARQRFTLALSLLHSEEIAAKAVAPSPGSAESAAQMQFDAIQLLNVCWALEPHVSTIRNLRDLAVELSLFNASINRQHPFKPMVDWLLATSQQMIKRLAELRQSLSTVSYPFDHAVQNISIADAIMGKQPANPNAVGDVNSCATMTANRFDALLFRALSRLCECAEKLELAVGLPLFPEPPAPQADKQAAEAEVQKRTRSTRKYWIGYGARALGGIAMYTLLVLLSVFPPSFDLNSTDSSRTIHYQPAAFRLLPERISTPVQMPHSSMQRMYSPNIAPSWQGNRYIPPPQPVRVPPVRVPPRPFIYHPPPTAGHR